MSFCIQGNKGLLNVIMSVLLCTVGRQKWKSLLSSLSQMSTLSRAFQTSAIKCPKYTQTSSKRRALSFESFRGDIRPCRLVSLKVLLHTSWTRVWAAVRDLRPGRTAQTLNAMTWAKEYTHKFSGICCFQFHDLQTVRLVKDTKTTSTGWKRMLGLKIGLYSGCVL